MDGTEPCGDGSRSGAGDPVHVKRGSAEPALRVREAEWLQELSGPGVVPLRAVRDGPEGPELVLAEAAGSLADILVERGTVSEAEARFVGLAAAACLARVHRAGLVHADVKPANLLLGPGGDLWLADLDAAAPADGRPLSRGSPGRAPVPAIAVPDTDLVALAVTVVELVSGFAPDPGVSWGRDQLVRLGCPGQLADDVLPFLVGDAVDWSCFIDTIGRGAARSLPRPQCSFGSEADTTPTVDLPITRTGPDPTGAPSGPRGAGQGSQRRARRLHRRRPPFPRSTR